MKEVSKHDIVCLERGDIIYIKHVADKLSGLSEPSRSELKNYAEALRGIARTATELEKLSTL